jgi:SAM-dependent methyltransferase
MAIRRWLEAEKQAISFLRGRAIKIRHPMKSRREGRKRIWMTADFEHKPRQHFSRRRDAHSSAEDQIKKTEFKQMSALQLDFPDGMFDWAVSTSMIEHLHLEDVDLHLHEVRRVLKAGGRYLM